MMKGKRVFLLSLLLAFVFTMQAQNNLVWKNKKCAVSLTYDDALHVHIDNVAPALDSLGLKGTFYLSGYFSGCRERLSDWKKIASHGHELANHTLFHPCTGKIPGREWVKPDYDLGSYTVQRMQDEIRMTNTLLSSLDGKLARTFAYPCGDTKIGDVFYIDKIKDDFVAARGVKAELTKIAEIDLYNTGSYMINGQSGEEMIALVKKAMETNSLLVFLFHGVGGEHSLNVDLREHSKLLHFLKQNEKDIWVAPFIEVAEYSKQYKAGEKVNR